MHDLLRDLYLREVEKDKFLWATKLQSLNKFSQDIDTQCRLGIHRGTWWEEKDEYHLTQIHDALQSATLACSLVYVSLKIVPYPNFRSSRILKALDLRGAQDYSIELPFQVVNLRYLAINAYWMQLDSQTIPSSVYLYWNLQTLIVNHFRTSDVDICKMPGFTSACEVDVVISQ